MQDELTRRFESGLFLALRSREHHKLPPEVAAIAAETFDTTERDRAEKAAADARQRADDLDRQAREGRAEADGATDTAQTFRGKDEKARRLEAQARTAESQAAQAEQDAERLRRETTVARARFEEDKHRRMAQATERHVRAVHERLDAMLAEIGPAAAAGAKAWEETTKQHTVKQRAQHAENASRAEAEEVAAA